MKLWNKYKVTSIPSLVFVDVATGKVVCRNGLLVVRDDPKGEFSRGGGRGVRSLEALTLEPRALTLTPGTRAPVVTLWKWR